MTAPRHAWDHLAEHHYRCRRCGMTRTNVWRQSGPWPDQGQWVAVFAGADGTRTEGRTPPCGGAPAVVAPAPPPAPPPWSLTIPAPTGGLRPVRAFLPLLAGPPDAAAEAYRAWLAAPRTPRGGCASCAHWWAQRDYCRHPRLGAHPVPAAAAREGDGWPLAPVAAHGPTLALRPVASTADGAYRPGGACGPLAALWVPREGGADDGR